MSRWFRPAIIALCAAPALLATPAALAGEPVFEVISQGKGKKEALVYRPTAGDKQTVTVRIDMTQKMSMSGLDLPAMEMPGMVTVMDCEVLEVRPDGSFQTSFLVTEARAEGNDKTPPELVQAVGQALQDTANVRFVSTLSSAGVTLESRSELPEDASPQTVKAFEDMSRGVDQMSSVLPTVPVGIGATWKVTQQLENNGMTVDQVATYTLKERSGDIATIGVAVKQTAERQKLAAASLPPGSQAELLSLSGDATGTIQLDVTKPAPVLSELESKTAFSMEVRAGGQQQQMATDMTLKMRLTGE